MPAGRPAIPAVLKRRLFEETGYRCAIPTCKATAALQLAHIEPWAQVHEHKFENMIVLCATDHFRFDQGEIPKASILAYKSNLSLMNARYSDMERRALDLFAEMPDDSIVPGLSFEVPGGLAFMFLHLIRDQIASLQDPQDGQVIIAGIPSKQFLTLLPDGVTLIKKIKSGRVIEPGLSV